MKNIAIIPARCGSKRIPKKNIKSFLGKPIIVYSIEAAIKSGLFDEVMVSTDDEEIADISKKYGAKIPFYRSKKNSDDYATTSDVIKEVLVGYQTNLKEFEYACCIYPTAPLINENRLKEAFDLLISNNYKSVFPVVRFSYPIQRALKFEQGHISMIWEENIRTRSQDLVPAYHDAGQFYWLKPSIFNLSKQLFTDYSGAVILNEVEVQDIDNETDWLLAELKFKLLNNS